MGLGWWQDKTVVIMHNTMDSYSRSRSLSKDVHICCIFRDCMVLSGELSVLLEPCHAMWVWVLNTTTCQTTEVVGKSSLIRYFLPTRWTIKTPGHCRHWIKRLTKTPGRPRDCIKPLTSSSSNMTYQTLHAIRSMQWWVFCIVQTL